MLMTLQQIFWECWVIAEIKVTPFIFIYLYILLKKICPCQPTKPPMLLSSSCLSLYMCSEKALPKGNNNNGTYTILRKREAHLLSCTHNMGN